MKWKGNRAVSPNLSLSLFEACANKYKQSQSSRRLYNEETKARKTEAPRKQASWAQLFFEVKPDTISTLELPVCT
jgi:hypothetical protein